MKRIYLDHAATTPLLPEAGNAMAAWLGPPANPSSLHAEGRAARAAVDRSRETVAEAFGCLFGEVTFTSSGTEAANLALVGTALANKDFNRTRVLLGAAEHHCVLHVQPLLNRLGYLTELVPVDESARVSSDVLEQMLADDVLLVSVMHANNELGTRNDVARLAQTAHRHGALFHTDAVQTFPYETKVEVLGADLVSVASHKVYGPTGAGALYVRSGTPIEAVAVGGGQERELRAGTENVAAIVGFAAATRAATGRDPERRDVRQVRDAFAEAVMGHGLSPTVEDWSGDAVLPGHFHARCTGIDAETMLIRLDRAGVSASSGAACSSGSLEPSHVLLACGHTEQEAREGLRFTFGLGNTIVDAHEAAERAKASIREILGART